MYVLKRTVSLTRYRKFIAFTFTFEPTPELEEPMEVRVTQSKSRRLIQKRSGQRGRIFVLFDTTKDNYYAVKLETKFDDLDSDSEEFHV
jgi:hypothetical protein